MNSTLPDDKGQPTQETVRRDVQEDKETYMNQDRDIYSEVREIFDEPDANLNRDILYKVMHMFHACGETKIGAYSLREAVDGGEFELNGFAADPEEAGKLAQAMINGGYVYDRDWNDRL